MPEKIPQDRKPKADEKGHSFTVKGKSYVLPYPDEKAADTVPGEITYAAVMEPDDSAAQMRLAFATLEAVKPSKAAKEALLSLGTNDMLEVVGLWLGESSGSSDS